MGEQVLKHTTAYRWKSGTEYRGEFKDGLPHGRGVMSFPNGNRYEGGFVEGKRNGKGVFTWCLGGLQNQTGGAKSEPIQERVNGVGAVHANGKLRKEELLKCGLTGGEQRNGFALVDLESREGVLASSPVDFETYTGAFVANERHGFGVHRSANGDVYEGEFYHGKRQGEGVLRLALGDTYRGQFGAGKRDGFGRIEYSNGNSFEGHWHSDKRSGKGIFYWTNGDRYEGEYLDDKQHGEGLLTKANGDTFKGSFKDNQIHGHAFYSSHSKGLTYEGSFISSLFHGHGLLTYSNGSFYEGDFKSGTKHGHGFGFYSDSLALFAEHWNDGLLFSRHPTVIHYDARRLVAQRGLSGQLADKIVELKAPTNEPLSPYSSVKESPLSSSTKLKRAGRAGSKAVKITSPSKPPATQEPKLSLNLSGALTEKGGIPSEHYKVILYIFGFLRTTDLVNVARVSKGWKFFLADSEVLWEILCKRRWTELHPHSAPVIGHSWKLLYQSKSVLFVKDAFRHGYGTFYWPNGNKYEGEWLDNKRHGIGAMSYGNKDVFIGDFKDGRKHGYGVYKFFNGTIYDGNWEKGRLHGRVKVTYCNGDRFDGIFYRGEKMGVGTMTYSKGSILSFIGEWRRGRREGNGREVTRSGEHIDAIWLNGNPIVEPKEEPIYTDEWQDWDSQSPYEDDRQYYRSKRLDHMVKRNTLQQFSAPGPGKT